MRFACLKIAFEKNPSRNNCIPSASIQLQNTNIQHLSEVRIQVVYRSDFHLRARQKCCDTDIEPVDGEYAFWRNGSGARA